MEKLLIKNVRALNPGQGVVASSIIVQKGTIAVLDPDTESCKNVECFDGSGKLLTPGMIDVHTHGISGERYDNHESIGPGSVKVAQFGTTTAVSTLSGRVADDLFERLGKIAEEAKKADGAHMDMFHLEGPFLALPGAGGEGVDGDVSLLKEIMSACCGCLKAMSISPDRKNIIPVIETLVENDVRPFITHTRANVEQTQKAIDAGARHATHFYDVFYPPEETDPGVRPVGSVETILADPRCTVDFICDGVHVHPTAVACALQAKGYEGVVLITDANSGAGFPPGIYDEGWSQRKIKVCEEGGCRIHDPGDKMHNGLAGSSLTMDAGIRNLCRWFDLPIEQIIAMGTSVPAKVMGLENRGFIKTGADADLVLWDEADDGLQVVRTWVNGKVIFSDD